MLGGLLLIYALSILLLGIYLHKQLHCDTIYISDCGRRATLAPCVLFVILFFAIHQNIGYANFGNTCLEMCKIAKLNGLTEFDSTKLTSPMIDYTTLAIMKRFTISEITLLRSQREFIFDIEDDPILTELTDKVFQTARKGLSHS
jgi:hypothetical protein